MNNKNKINPINGDAVGSQTAGMLMNTGSSSGLLQSGHHNQQQRQTYLVLLCTSVLLAVSGFALIVYWMKPKLMGFSFNDADQLSSLHPVLMYFFMFGLNLYAVLIYRTHYSSQKSKLKWTHGLLAMANITFSLLGVFFMFRSHQLKGMANFYSLHSWIGVATNGLYFSQLLAGVFAFLRPSTSHAIRATIMPWHRSLGAYILALATLAVITGIGELVIFRQQEAYASFASITFIVNFAALFTIVAATIAIFLLATPTYLRPPKPEEGLVAHLE